MELCFPWGMPVIQYAIGATKPQKQIGNASESWKSEKRKNFTSLVLGHAPSEVAVVENVLRQVWRCDMTSHHNRHGVGCCHKHRETVLKLEAADLVQLSRFAGPLDRAVCHWDTERALASPNKLNPVQQNQRAKAQLCCHWQKPWTHWKFDKSQLQKSNLSHHVTTYHGLAFPFPMVWDYGNGSFPRGCWWQPLLSRWRNIRGTSPKNTHEDIEWHVNMVNLRLTLSGTWWWDSVNVSPLVFQAPLACYLWISDLCAGRKLLFWNDTHHLRKAILMISTHTSGNVKVLGARQEKILRQKNYRKTTEVKVAQDHVNLICNTVQCAFWTFCSLAWVSPSLPHFPFPLSVHWLQAARNIPASEQAHGEENTCEEHTSDWQSLKVKRSTNITLSDLIGNAGCKKAWKNVVDFNFRNEVSIQDLDSGTQHVSINICSVARFQG